MVNPSVNMWMNPIIIWRVTIVFTAILVFFLSLPVWNDLYVTSLFHHQGSGSVSVAAVCVCVVCVCAVYCVCSVCVCSVCVHRVVATLEWLKATVETHEVIS